MRQGDLFKYSGELMQTHDEMTKITRNIIAAVALGMLIAGVSGCKKEGPLERAGKEIDRAAEKTGEKIEKVGDKIKDAVK